MTEFINLQQFPPGLSDPVLIVRVVHGGIYRQTDKCSDTDA